MKTNTLQAHILKVAILALLFPLMSFSQKIIPAGGADLFFADPAKAKLVLSPTGVIQGPSVGSGANAGAMVINSSSPIPDVLNLPDIIGECSAAISTTPTATAHSGGVVTGTTSDSLSYTVQGTYVIQWMYDDGNGNISYQNQNVIVQDITAPQPDNTNLPDVTGECSATIVTAPTATDNCAGAIIATTQDSLSYTTQGTYIIQWTYDDGNGNISSQSQNVIVKDRTAPVPNMTNLPDVTGECSATIGTVPTAMDNCAGIIIATTDNPLHYITKGTYIVRWTFNDGNGNITSQNQNVIIQALNVPVPDTASLPDIAGECSATVVTVPTATDNCTGLAVIGATSDPLTYTSQGTYIIEWIYDDGYGNTSLQYQNVIVQDITAPVPDNSNVPDVTGECSAAIVTVPTATDNCAGVIIATTQDSLSYSAQGTYIVKWTFDDGNGNISSQNQNVIVKDRTAPVPNMTNLPDVTGECAATVGTVPTATDNCAGAIIGTTLDPLYYKALGTHIIHWTYNDGNGNISSQNQNVIVQDTTAPVPDNAYLPNVTGECSATIVAVPTATDNCAGAVIGTTLDPLSYTKQGAYTIHWTFNDGNGNTSFQDQNVIVKDMSPPTFTALPNTASCNGLVLSIAPLNVSDNCSSNISITYQLSGATIASGVSDASRERFQPGTTLVTYTFSDGNGNSSQDSFNVENTGNDIEIIVHQDTLIATETGTYQWYNCTNHVPISNENARSYTALHCGVYSVIISQNNGCRDTSDCIAIISTGMQKNLNNALMNVSVFPNPTNGLINITSDIDNVDVQFFIVDVNGNEVYAHSVLNNTSTMINIEKLAQGVYFMKLFNKEGQKVIKIVKQ